MFPIRNALSRVGRACLHNSTATTKRIIQRRSVSAPVPVTNIISRSSVFPACRPFSTIPKLEVLEDDQSVDTELTNALGRHQEHQGRSVQEIMAQYAGSHDLTKEQIVGFLEELSGQYNFKEASTVFADLKARALADAKAYSLLVKAARPSLYFHELRFLFGEPLEGREDEQGQETRTSPHFTAICQCLEEMRAKGMQLDMAFYEDLMASLSAGRQAGIMINICTTLEKKGVVPSTAFYNQLLMTLPKRGFMQRASVLFDRLVLRGQANFQTHLIRLNWLASTGRLDDAERTFQDLSERFVMSRIPYNIMVSGYLKAGRVNDAVRLFSTMKASASCQPDRVTLSSFLSYFYASGDLQHAPLVVEQLAGCGYPKTSRDFGLLIRLHSRYDPADAVKLLAACLDRQTFDGTLCNELVRVIVDKRVLNEWKDTLMDMVVARHPADAHPLGDLIPDRPVSHSGQAFRNMVRELLVIMGTMGWAPSMFTLEYIVRRMLLQDDYAKLPLMTAYLRDSQVTMTWNLKNLLVQAHLGAGDRQAATDQLALIARSKTPLTTNACNALERAGIPVPANVRRMGHDVDSGESVQASQKQHPKVPVGM